VLPCQYDLFDLHFSFVLVYKYVCFSARERFLFFFDELALTYKKIQVQSRETGGGDKQQQKLSAAG